MVTDRISTLPHAGSASWRVTGPVLVGLLGLIPVLYRPGAGYLAGIWSDYRDGPYGHGFLVLGLCVFLIWQRRRQLLAVEPCPAVPALPLLAGCGAVWLAAVSVDIQLLQVVVLLCLPLAVTWAIAGWRVVRLVLFPVLCIVFALPVWSPILPVLRECTAAGAYLLIRMAGITAYVQDFVVQLPSGELYIEEACSGLNYLLAAMTLGVLHGCLNYQSVRARIMIVALAAGSALLANILRVFIIVYLAFKSDMQHPMVRDHVMLGWYLFGALVLTLLVIDYYLHIRRKHPAAVDMPVTVALAGPAGCRSLSGRYALAAVVAALLVAGPAAAWWLQHVGVRQSAILQLPAGTDGWSGPERIFDTWVPVFHGASGQMVLYRKGGDRILLYAGFYPRQSQGQELINDLNRISSGKYWQSSGQNIAVTTADGQVLLETVLSAADNRRRLVWYRYRVAGHDTINPYAAKLFQFAGVLSGQRRAAVLALAVDDDPGQGDARALLENFLADMGPAIGHSLDGE